MATRSVILALGSLLALSGMPMTLAQSGGDVAVVVNEKNSVSNVSYEQLRKIFAGERRAWPGGVPVKLIVRAPGSAERIALLKLLGMSEGEYKQYWTAQIFRGEAQSEPPALFSNGMQKEALSVFPGAVALVSARDVKQGMKVVRVDGHAPGEPGYPLK
jgi:phosphate transport system substrate-binding protein